MYAAIDACVCVPTTVYDTAMYITISLVCPRHVYALYFGIVISTAVSMTMHLFILLYLSIKNTFWMVDLHVFMNFEQCTFNVGL